MATQDDPPTLRARARQRASDDALALADFKRAVHDDALESGHTCPDCGETELIEATPELSESLLCHVCYLTWTEPANGKGPGS